jgi:hypothetical protein
VYETKTQDHINLDFAGYDCGDEPSDHSSEPDDQNSSISSIEQEDMKKDSSSDIEVEKLSKTGGDIFHSEKVI